MSLDIVPTWIHESWTDYAIVVASVFLTYIILIAYVRIFGLRTFAKMTAFDFATTVAIGSTIATVCVSNKVNVGTGAVALLSIILVQVVLAFAQSKSPLFKHLAKNTPILLMKNGEILHENLQKCKLQRQELLSKLREKGVARLNEVQAVVFESTGNISVMCGSDGVDEELLEEIRK
jgi:uncharacterized membrane protein YcaP (DUF421 family)